MPNPELLLTPAELRGRAADSGRRAEEARDRRRATDQAPPDPHGDEKAHLSAERHRLHEAQKEGAVPPRVGPTLSATEKRRTRVVTPPRMVTPPTATKASTSSSP